jgi:flagellar hook-associated protein 3 FlgL
MDRVSSASSYQAILLDIMNNETAQNVAEQQVTTGKISNDLSGYATQADALTATQSLQARISADLANGSALSDQLTAQNQALSTVATAAEGASNAVSEALATGDVTTLMTTLQSQFSTATSALNTQYNGQYLFSGGQSSTAPVNATSLSDLAGGVAGVFQNGQTPQVSRLNDDTKITTGVLASAVGTPLFTALQSIQAYSSGPNGPLTGALNTAQTSFLQGVLTTLQSAYSTVNDAVAANGVTQDQVTASQAALTAQNTTLTNTIGDITDADAAKASTNLQLAQTALQASAQVFATLNNASLLDVLSATTS